MNIALHKNARTTPAIRAEIAASGNLSARQLSERCGVTEATIYKWKRCDSTADRSHTAHRLQTTLTPAQEAVAVELRRTLLLPLDALLAVVREFLCADVSRLGLDRCLRRHGVGSLEALKPAVAKQPHKAFKAYEPGYLHMDIKYLPQMAGDHHRHQRERRPTFSSCERFFQLGARHGVVRMVASRRRHQNVDVRRHQSAPRAAPCCCAAPRPRQDRCVL